MENLNCFSTSSNVVSVPNESGSFIIIIKSKLDDCYGTIHLLANSDYSSGIRLITDSKLNVITKGKGITLDDLFSPDFHNIEEDIIMDMLKEYLNKSIKTKYYEDHSVFKKNSYLLEFGEYPTYTRIFDMVDYYQIFIVRVVNNLYNFNYAKLYKEDFI